MLGGAAAERDLPPSQEIGGVSSPPHRRAGAMLRSGRGWLDSAPAKPHPRENPWIIVLMVCGVTASEVAASQSSVEGTGKLGDTRLMSPGDLLTLAFLNNTLFTE